MECTSAHADRMAYAGRYPHSLYERASPFRCDHPPRDPDVRPEAREPSREVVGGGAQCVVGERFERVEDEEGGGRVVPQLGAATLAPVPAAASNAFLVAPDHLARLTLWLPARSFELSVLRRTGEHGGSILVTPSHLPELAPTGNPVSVLTPTHW